MSPDSIFQLEVFFFIGCAQIAAALTGFIGVVYVVGERSHGRLNTHESSAVFHFMLAGLGTLFLSLFTALLLVCFSAQASVAWQVANAANGLFHFTGASRLAREQWRHESGVRQGYATAGLGLAAAAASFAAAAGYLPQYSHFILMLGTLWALGVTVISFNSLLMMPRTT